MGRQLTEVRKAIDSYRIGPDGGFLWDRIAAHGFNVRAGLHCGHGLRSRDASGFAGGGS